MTDKNPNIIMEKDYNIILGTVHECNIKNESFLEIKPFLINKVGYCCFFTLNLDENDD